MMIRRLSTWVVLTSMLFETPLGAQAPGPSSSQAGERKRAQGSPSTDWDRQIQQYQELLNDIDITSDPDVKHAVYLKWIEATCQSKRAKVQEVIGRSDTSLATSVYSTCVKRLQSQESNDGSIEATTTLPHSATTSATPPGAAPNVTLPQGCAPPVSQLNDHFKTDTPLQITTPSSDAWHADREWVQLNANSSGGELSTKSTVWLGFINRLRYSATLGGVVTAIAAPTIPDSIFPSVSTPASQPAPNKPAKAAPLRGVQSVFDSFTTCFQDISTAVVTFQNRLSSEELLMNDVRDRIDNHINSLQPIVATIEEARAAADRSLLPPKEIPAFPIGDVIQLKGLLTEFTSKYAQFAQWVRADAWNATEFQRVSTGVASIAQALDKYMGLPSTSSTNPPAPPNPTTTNSNSANSGAAITGGTPAGEAGGTGPVATSQRADSKKPKAKVTNPNARQAEATQITNSAAGRTRDSTEGTSSVAENGTGTRTDQGSGATAANATGNGTAQQAAIPSAIEVGTKEVKNYEATREYINRWSDAFRKVAVAPPGYFVATYKPQCGGWFGQGTSTQMQLTILDVTNPSQNSAPRNLDKVVCQSPLTVTNGLGLSFIPDRTPSFVPSTNSGTNGSPVLGYSSESSIRPAYALQVNAALLSLRESNFEFHWSLGAMLTAVTGGATTDIITGPSFSFKKRAFFISPVYDIGQRTVFQRGFNVGTSQGVLTSPPTRQIWKSGFGLTITFPLNPGSKNTNSSNSTGNSGTNTTGSGTTAGTGSKKDSKE